MMLQQQVPDIHNTKRVASYVGSYCMLGIVKMNFYGLHICKNITQLKRITINKKVKDMNL